jgi:hypothetical protein
MSFNLSPPNQTGALPTLGPSNVLSDLIFNILDDDFHNFPKEAIS